MGPPAGTLVPMVRRPDWMPEAAESWQIFFMAGKACEAASEARESAQEFFPRSTPSQVTIELSLSVSAR